MGEATKMEVETVQGKPITLKVTGDVELDSVDELRQALDQAIERSPKGLIIDLTNTNYIDSVGLGVIISAYRRLTSKGGSIALVPSHAVQQILRFIRVDLMPRFYVCSDYPSAVQALKELGCEE